MINSLSKSNCSPMATIWGWKDFNNSSSIEAVLCKKKNKNEKNESPNPIKMSKTKSQKKKVVTKRLLSDQLD